MGLRDRRNPQRSPYVTSKGTPLYWRSRRSPIICYRRMANGSVWKRTERPVLMATHIGGGLRGLADEDLAHVSSPVAPAQTGGHLRARPAGAAGCCGHREAGRRCLRTPRRRCRAGSIPVRDERPRCGPPGDPVRPQADRGLMLAHDAPRSCCRLLRSAAGPGGCTVGPVGRTAGLGAASVTRHAAGAAGRRPAARQRPRRRARRGPATARSAAS